MTYASHDFRIDGVDRFVCGGKNDLRFSGVVRYVDITAPWRIVYTEVISEGDKRLAASLVTWSLGDTRDGTRLVVTDQVTSFVGAEMIEGSRMGMAAALDNLTGALVM